LGFLYEKAKAVNVKKEMAIITQNPLKPNHSDENYTKGVSTSDDN